MDSNFWRRLRADFGYYVLSLRTQVKAEMTLRTSFVLQIVGMILNSAIFVTAWLFFFVQFGSVNGWTANDLVAMQGANMLIFGLICFLSSGLSDLPEHVDRGSFDSLLLRPSSLVLQLAASRADVPAIGDTILGLALSIWYIVSSSSSMTSTAFFLATLLIGGVIFWCFFFSVNILAFYIFGAEQIAGYIVGLFLAGALFPSGVLSGYLRKFLLVVFPVLFMGSVQVEVLRGLGPWIIALGLAVAAGWLIFSFALFRSSIKKYESANLVGAK